MCALAFIALLSAAFSGPPPAGGQEPEPNPSPPTDRPVDDTRTRESLRIAERFFGAQPECGPVHVYRADLGAGTDNALRGATARPDLCSIWLHDGYQPRGWRARVDGCTQLVHEYGHLLALHHVDDPRSVMQPQPTWVTIPDCYRRFRPLPPRPRFGQVWARRWAMPSRPRDGASERART